MRSHISGHTWSGLVVSLIFVSRPLHHLYPSLGGGLRRGNSVLPTQGVDNDLATSLLRLGINTLLGNVFGIGIFGGGGGTKPAGIGKVKGEKR